MSAEPQENVVYEIRYRDDAGDVATAAAYYRPNIFCPAVGRSGYWHADEVISFRQVWPAPGRHGIAARLDAVERDARALLARADAIEAEINRRAASQTLTLSIDGPNVVCACGHARRRHCMETGCVECICASISGVIYGPVRA